MKKISIFCLAVAVMAVLYACVKNLEDEGVYTETEIIGTVVEKSTNVPVPNVKVMVTDGDHIHSSTNTNQQGKFSLKVNFDQVNKNYYLFLDGSPNLPSKQEKLHGMGNKVYDYKTLILYDATNSELLPQVTTGSVTDITETSATASGNAVSNGGQNLTERGVCYATHQMPTISDIHRSATGTSLGVFSCYLTGLQSNTTYYVRAYARNSIGISYGTQRSFTTSNGLPKVTTTAPTMNGTTVTTGGNVTSDGGHPVTARGICYGIYPNPDLSSTYQHTENGSGTGYFTSTFTHPEGAGVYYVRAYATNEKGTAYGNQVMAANPYDTLPTFQFNGQTYKVAPCPHDSPDEYMSWSAANAYCENLTAYGFSDWRMPTQEELQTMYLNRVSIGGWFAPYTSSTNYTCRPVYWSSTATNSGSSYHRYIIWTDGSVGSDIHDNNDGYYCWSGGYYCLLAHVRPIRIDQ